MTRSLEFKVYQKSTYQQLYTWRNSKFQKQISSARTELRRKKSEKKSVIIDSTIKKNLTKKEHKEILASLTISSNIRN